MGISPGAIAEEETLRTRGSAVWGLSYIGHKPQPLPFSFDIQSVLVDDMTTHLQPSQDSCSCAYEIDASIFSTAVGWMHLNLFGLG